VAHRIIFEQISVSCRFILGKLWIVLIALFLLQAIPGQAAVKETPEVKKAPEKTPEIQKAPAPQASAAIPVAEVAKRATEVSNLLRSLKTLLVPSPHIETIQKQLPNVSRDIALALSDTKKVLQALPTLAVLQSAQQLWEKRQTEMTGWLNLLTKRANQLQGALSQLTDLEKTWSQTLNAANASKAPDLILQQIDATISEIRGVLRPLQTQHTAMLDLQSRVSQEVELCGTALAEIGQAQQKAVGGLLKRESFPIWKAELWVLMRNEGWGRVRQIAAGQWVDIKQYIHDSSKGMPLHVGLFVLLVILLCMMRREVHRWATPGKGPDPATTVFDRPFSAALVITLFVATSPNLPTPVTVRHIFSVLELAPIIRLTQPVVNPLIVTGLYVLGGLFALNTFREAFAGAPFIEQAVTLIEILAGMAALGWALTLGNLRRSNEHEKTLARLSGIRVTASLILLILAACGGAGALGYIRLARLLTNTLIGGCALVLALFAYVRVIVGVVAFALRVWPFRLLQMVQHHRELLERRTYRVFIWLAIIAWLMRVLDYVGLFEPSRSFGKALLAAKLERGSISISVEDILAFFLTVWVAYLLSAFIRFVLQEDVYPRMRIAPGLSYAISSLLRYVFIALGFVVGLGVLGVNLSKVTVLAGAFGVGIGFGLQSIVNNFVSGLILLFERPVHVGDTVEVGNLLGEVRRIGIRSSIVRTWHGADIIVPNSQLVTEQVTNWTLSDQLRRIDLPVGVNYSAEPKKVIEVMETVARAHPKVLQHPPPQCLFVGYGDSSINFELRAWTDQFEKWAQTRSELAVALYDAVHEAGMTFPFPQREVRLLRDPEDGSTPVPCVGEPQTSPMEEQGKPPATAPKKLE
jgi:small-conductance mechanosensitive channel